jgi:hypothetical protein
MREIQLKSLEDLGRFVEDYNPSPQVLATIISTKLKIWPIPNEFKTSKEMMAQLLTMLANYHPQDLPLFLTNPTQPHAQ